MKLWMLQWNLYVPAAGAVKVAVLPASIVTLKPPPSWETVCRDVLSFFTVTVDAALTGIGWKVKLESIVIWAVAGLDAAGVVVLLLLPQAARPSASADMAMKMRMRRCMPGIRSEWRTR